MRTALLTLGLLVACEPAPEPTVEVEPMTWKAEAGDPPGLAKFRRWSEDLAQGARPAGEAGLRSLAALGFETVLCVEGRMPDARTAQRFGLRTVHAPIGYDAVSSTAIRHIVNAARTTKGALFVHGRAGGARTLAAATIVRREKEGLSTQQALKAAASVMDLRAHGALFAAVQNFNSSEVTDLQDPLPNGVEPGGLKATMLAIEEAWEILGAVRGNGWNPPSTLADAEPVQQALSIATLLDEAGAHRSDGRFPLMLRDAQTASRLLAAAIHKRDDAKADRAYRRLEQGCTHCHAQFR